MNCSNCNVVDFNSGANHAGEIICENGHFLCAKCYASSRNRCIKCDKNIPIGQHFANMITLDMFDTWANMIEGPFCQYSAEECDRNVECDSRDTAPIKLLFSRPQYFGQKDSEFNDDEESLNTQCSEACGDQNFNIEIGHIKGQSPKRLECSVDHMNCGTYLGYEKDLSQKLVHQTKQEIRDKDLQSSMEHLNYDTYRSHKKDSRQKLVDQTKEGSRDKHLECSMERKNYDTYRCYEKDSRQKLVDQTKEESREKHLECSVEHMNYDTYRGHEKDSRQKLVDQTKEELREKHLESSMEHLNYNTYRGHEKDSRQKLVDQTKEELREKIKKELFSSFKSNMMAEIKPEQSACVKQSKTIGTSTRSEPKIQDPTECSKESKEQLVEVIDLNPKGSLAVNTEAKPKETPKSLCSEEEEEKQQLPPSTTTQNNHFLEILRTKLSKIPSDKLDHFITSILSTNESETSNENNSNKLKHSPPQQTNNDFLLISNSSRASYTPSSCHQISTIPKPQFELIASSTMPLAQSVDAATLQIPRSPVTCPISSCRQACFVSNVTHHIAFNHPDVHIERIHPRHCKNFFLDPKLINFGSNRCQLLLLVKDKIKNWGHEKFKDYIPVLLLTTKVSTFELCCSETVPNEKNNNEIDGGFVMIWLTGLTSPEIPMFFSLTIWARTDMGPSCHIVHSGELYSIRNSQNPTSIEQSGQRLLLSEKQIDLLTNNGRNMLELQVVIN